MKGELTHSQMEELLQSQVLGRIAAHADGATYIIPISYAYEKAFIYVHCDEGMLVRTLRKSVDVCFEVDNIKDLANWQCVVAWGPYEELTEMNARTEALQKLKGRELPPAVSESTQLSPDWPFSDDLTSIRGIVFRIPVHKMTGRYESSNEVFPR